MGDGWRKTETSFMIDQKHISIYPGSSSSAPVLYVNTIEEEGEELYHTVRDISQMDFSLVTISGLVWEHDLSPWENLPIIPNGLAFTKGADDYIQFLLERILPRAETWLGGLPVWRALAGYSLAGLFAVYSLYHTAIFSRVASISGSLWFPGFREYVLSHKMKRRPDCIYFSLGSKESKTRNPFLKSVQQKTEELEAIYRGQGIDTAFVRNPGNHYTEPVRRTARGLAWLLSK